MKKKAFFPMWDSKPKKITSATLGLEAKIALTTIIIYSIYNKKILYPWVKIDAFFKIFSST